MSRKHNNRPPRGYDICPNCHDIVTVLPDGTWACPTCGACADLNANKPLRIRPKSRDKTGT